MKKKRFNSEKFSKDIRTKRLINNRISLRELAQMVDINFTVLNKYENMIIEPGIESLIKVCEWLGTSIDDYIIK